MKRVILSAIILSFGTFSFAAGHYMSPVLDRQVVIEHSKCFSTINNVIDKRVGSPVVLEPLYTADQTKAIFGTNKSGENKFMETTYFVEKFGCYFSAKVTIKSLASTYEGITETILDCDVTNVDRDGEGDCGPS